MIAIHRGLRQTLCLPRETFKCEFGMLINLKTQNKTWQPHVCLGECPLALIQLCDHVHQVNYVAI